MLNTIPESVVQSWPQPNYVDPETRGDAIVVLTALGLATCTVTIALKIYARLIRVRPGGLDDWLIVFAWVCAVGNQASSLLGVYRYSGNVHIWDFRVEHFRSYRITNLAVAAFYYWSSSLAKISLLIFYRRIYKNLHFRLLVDIMIVFTMLYLAVVSVLHFVQCRPLSYYWLFINPDAEGSCIKEGTWNVAAGVVNIFADFAILLLPLRIIYTLNISAMQRLQLTLLLCSGLLVCVAGILRVYYVHVTSTTPDYDSSWYAYDVMVWSAVEVDLSIICATLPACKSLFAAWKANCSHPSGKSHEKPTPKEVVTAAATTSSTGGDATAKPGPLVFQGLGILSDPHSEDLESHQSQSTSFSAEFDKTHVKSHAETQGGV